MVGAGTVLNSYGSTTLLICKKTDNCISLVAKLTVILLLGCAVKIYRDHQRTCILLIYSFLNI